MGMNAERRVQKAKISLLRSPDYALWSGLMMMGSTEVIEDFPTAYTDGRNEKYGRAFVGRLSDKELLFVILHENMHKGFRHLYIWRKLWVEDAQLANAACDYVINGLLVESDPDEKVIAFPKHPDGSRFGLYDPKFRGMHAKQVFDLLKQEQEGGGKAGAGAGGFDKHGWEEAGNLTEQEVTELERDIDRALRQGMIAQEKLAGKSAGGMARAVGELLTPEIDWREQLREFVSSVCANKDTSSWRKVNRRFIGSDIYMPSLVGETVGRLCVGIDTSGSIGGKELDRFLSEVHSVATDVQPEAIDLMYWDTEVAVHEEYDRYSMQGLVQSTKPKGGGGTDPECVPRYMKKRQLKPECIIMLTDGCVSSWGEWDVPVLWVVVGNSGVVAPVGKTIHIRVV